MKEQKKQLSLFNLISLGVGAAIGSGIFVMVGGGIAYTGRSISIAMIIGCIVMMFAYAYNIVLSSVFKLDGGPYDQQLLLCPNLISGAFGITTFISSVAFAMYAIAITTYLSSIFPGIAPYSKLLAIIIQTLFFASSIKGSKFMAIIESIMTVVLMSSIIIFIIVGIPKLEPGFFSSGQFFTNGRSGFLSAIAIMSFACMGTTSPVYMTAESKNPKKNVPIAILITTLIVALIYCGVGTVASGVLPVDKVAGQPLSQVAEAVFPRAIFIIFIIGGAVFALATSLLGGIMILKHPILATAEDGWLPKVLAKKKGDFPYVLMGLMYLLAIVPIMTGTSLDTLVSYVMIPLMTMNGIANIMMLKIPKKYPNQWKKSILNMPNPLFVVLVLFSVGCNIFVISYLFSMLDTQSKIIIGSITVLIFVFGYIRMKFGYVDIKKLEEKRQAVIQVALNE